MLRSRLLSGLGLAFIAMEAHALGIGEIIDQPRLGERLRIELRLHADDVQIDPSCIRLSPGDGTDDLPWVRSARLRVRSGGRPTLIVESSDVVTHPIYMLGLRLGCGAEVRREFTMMPQPPVELPSVAAEPVPAQNAPARSAAVDVAAGIGSFERGGWTIVAGETLASIAAALFPDSTRNQKSFVRETVRANPQLFANVADPANHPLPAGENLMLPGSGAKAPAPARAARPPAPRTAGEVRKPRDSQAAAEARVPARRPESVSKSEDRLMVASGSASESGLKFTTLLNDARSRGLSEEQREKLRQEQRLIAQLDEKIIASLALAEKIRNMEDYLEKLQGDMSRLDQQIRGASGAAAAGPSLSTPPAAPTPQRESAPAAVPVQPSVETTKVAPKPPAKTVVEDSAIDWKIYGGLAAVLALLGALWWRRRQSADAGFAPDVEPVPEPAETEIPPSLPAVEPTLAQQVPTQRVELAAPLELELEQPSESESKIAVAEHDSALELAEIMLSFGRVQGAAQTLTDYIHSNPKHAIRPWLRLLEIYHGAGMQKEFDAVMDQFHQNFNVQSVSWSDYGRELSRTSIESMPHLIQEVIASWPSRGCLELLQNYLLDNREGTRSGFPLSIADDIATLVGILESRHISGSQSAAS